MKTLKEIRENMRANIADLTVTINGVSLPVSNKFLESAIVAGLYRQMSMDLAKDDSEVEREKIIARFSRGYLTASEEKKATAPLVETSKGSKRGHSVPFSQMEIVAQARSMVKKNDTVSHTALDNIALYDDKKFGLLLVSVADKPESLISRAIAELLKAANEKVERERAALMAELEII